MFIKSASLKFDRSSIRLLDIAPQDHEGAKQFFHNAEVLTADIDPNSNADFIVDICSKNCSVIPNNHFDVVLCMEVLEHTLNPFAAVSEIRRMLKPGGTVFISTPFNFRIHGPLPDCWRFTVHGLQALLREFKSVEIEELEDKNRFLMPFHYTTVAVK
ncbi:class I SAM-dependent methyltransferase [Marinihelvus fidelis]|nr:methyltransferase domain-containing protein [Marinihelvus fidelis]